MVRRNVLFDFASTIVTEKRFEDITVAEFVAAARARLDSIAADDAVNPGEGLEAFGLCDEYEEDEECA